MLFANFNQLVLNICKAGSKKWMVLSQKNKMKKIVATLLVLCTGLQLFSQHVTRSNPATLFDPTPFAFTHATSTQKSGRYVFISGQSGGEDLQHKLSDNFRTQVQYALKNLQTVLATYDLQVGDVLKITVLIVNHDEKKLKIWTEEMQKTWGNQGFPASTLIPVPRLALEDMQIEVDAIAFIADK